MGRGSAQGPGHTDQPWPGHRPGHTGRSLDRCLGQPSARRWGTLALRVPKAAKHRRPDRIGSGSGGITKAITALAHTHARASPQSKGFTAGSCECASSTTTAPTSATTPGAVAPPASSESATLRGASCGEAPAGSGCMSASCATHARATVHHRAPCAKGGGWRLEPFARNCASLAARSGRACKLAWAAAYSCYSMASF